MKEANDRRANGVLLVQLAYSSERHASEKRQNLLNAWSFLEAQTNHDRDLLPAANAPGYLVAQTSGGNNFFVPLNLVRVSPKAFQRSEIEAISHDMKIRSDFEVCLSGSGTFMGVSEFIGDLDFAEYYIPPHQDVVSGIDCLSASCAYPSLEIEWIQAYFPKGAPRRILKASLGDRVRIMSSIKLSGWRKIQVGASADLKALGLGQKELTNMILPTQDQSGTSEFSHIYQEIVMTIQENSPQRSLVDRDQIVGYFEFLIREAKVKLAASKKKNCVKNAAKALKRAISLIMLLADRVLFAKGLALLPRSADSSLEMNKVRAFVEEVLEAARQVRTLQGTITRVADAG